MLDFAKAVVANEAASDVDVQLVIIGCGLVECLSKNMLAEFAWKTLESRHGCAMVCCDDSCFVVMSMLMLGFQSW